MNERQGRQVMAPVLKGGRRQLACLAVISSYFVVFMLFD
jgi:hypothetical protein